MTKKKNRAASEKDRRVPWVPALGALAAVVTAYFVYQQVVEQRRSLDIVQASARAQIIVKEIKWKLPTPGDFFTYGVVWKNTGTTLAKRVREKSCVDAF